MLRKKNGTVRMNSSKKAKRREAFTRSDLIVVLAAVGFLFLLAFFILSVLSSAKGQVLQINCASQLKSISLAFRIWEGDNDDRFPVQVFTNQLGEQQFATGSNAFRYFQVMSNEINNPVILICPADKARKPAVNFSTGFDGRHISYFIGLDADEKFPRRFLSGDSNITNGVALRDGVMELTTTQQGGWTNERHRRSGNIALGDGSVSEPYGQEFQELVLRTGLTTNRLLFPQ